MEELRKNKRVRDNTVENELDSAEVKRLRDDLLDNLDDSDPSATIPDLESFMKSFEREISASPSPAMVDLSSDPGDGESQPDLGFLLEASDDELGLPPSKTAPSFQSNEEDSGLLRIPPEPSAELRDLWRLDDEIPSYDSFDFGNNYNFNDNGDYSAFDYSDSGLDFYDAPLPLWRPETMPAL